jgi:hypothetical protein
MAILPASRSAQGVRSVCVAEAGPLATGHESRSPEAGSTAMSLDQTLGANGAPLLLALASAQEGGNGELPTP